MYAIAFDLNTKEFEDANRYLIIGDLKGLVSCTSRVCIMARWRDEGDLRKLWSVCNAALLVRDRAKIWRTTELFSDLRVLKIVDR
jgi:hypothetical protein